jgi:2-polyprenyl-3-methyl-5-hydroxy-6-metoxy-1,4-benzoquinol methylase
MSIETRFNNIYKKGLWDGKGQSRSGAGSTLEATQNIRAELPKLLRKLNASSFVDLGCGDFYWMKEVDLPCKYIGLDIVKEVIEENRQQYANDWRKFNHHNAVKDKLPEISDVVFCREVLFHLSFEDGLKLINQVTASNARYFLATTSLELKENRDIRTGQFRNINLLLPPYSFPPCSITIKDSETVSQDRYLGLWEVEAIKEAVS